MMNELTGAQRERLAMLAEEAGEVVQAVTKILRHGYESHHPHRPNGQSNRQHLRKELEDLMAVIWAMQTRGDFPPLLATPDDFKRTWESKLRWTHYQGADEAKAVGAETAGRTRLDRLLDDVDQAEANTGRWFGVSVMDLSHDELRKLLHWNMVQTGQRHDPD